MILSHSRRFILVKTRKTASTSLERAIIPHLDPRDTWTPISLPAVAGRNYYSLWPADILSAKWFRAREWIGRDHWLHHRFAYDHMPISQIRRWLSADAFGQYRKYAFDRNPWDFIVSYWFFYRRKERASHWDFDRFLHEYPIISNWDLYTENGLVAVDKVYRFEELSSAVNEIAAQTGLALGILPEDKRNYREARDYRSYYTASSRDLVAARWDRTIQLLGYDF
ncbi:hypothetical protein [Aestuariivirga sp.]|jgi:hypothetical protein|uniref:hypothetical protein n=1 Tax=Aestuariivirga sp. TaxID=2650926 RepID=UPI003784B7A6